MDGMFVFFSCTRRVTRWTGDWSSDVCSSDLASFSVWRPAAPNAPNAERGCGPALGAAGDQAARGEQVEHALQIGRASCRERVVLMRAAISFKVKTLATFKLPCYYLMFVSLLR